MLAGAAENLASVQQAGAGSTDETPAAQDKPATTQVKQEQHTPERRKAAHATATPAAEAMAETATLPPLGNEDASQREVETPKED